MVKLTRILISAMCVGMFTLGSTMIFADDDPPGGQVAGGSKGVSYSKSFSGSKGTKGAAKGKQTLPPQAKGAAKTGSEKNIATVPRAVFTPDEKKVIFNYFQNNAYSSTFLPPGIAMNLARGKPLPPGIAKKNIPSDLAKQLYINPAYDYYLIGNNVVTADKTTAIVADMLDITARTTTSK